MDQAHLVTQGRKNQRWQRAKARFDKIQQQEGGGPSTSNKPQTQWVSGGTEAMEVGVATSGNDADNQEDIIEILSPGREDNSSFPSKEDLPPTSSSTTPIETPANSVTSTSTEGSTTVTVSELSSEPRPKIQMKLQSKRGKEQLPVTSSVVLDDGDDDEEEEGDEGEGKGEKEVAMEVNGSGDKREEVAVTSAMKDAKGNTRKGKRTENNETNDTTSDNKSDPSVEETTSSETGKKKTIESTTTAGGSNVLGTEGDDKMRKSPRGKSSKGKWVKIGDGDQNKGEGERAEGKKVQGKEAGTSEEGASAISEGAGTDSQSDGARGRRRRTKRGGKKSEDMFADL